MCMIGVCLAFNQQGNIGQFINQHMGGGEQVGVAHYSGKQPGGQDTENTRTNDSWSFLWSTKLESVCSSKLMSLRLSCTTFGLSSIPLTARVSVASSGPLFCQESVCSSWLASQCSSTTSPPKDMESIFLPFFASLLSNVVPSELFIGSSKKTGLSSCLLIVLVVS